MRGAIPSGGSLLTLQKSQAVREFEGVVSRPVADAPQIRPNIADVSRGDWLPRRVVAIDASTLTQRVRNGFPGAEASLLMLSVVFIDISKLAAIQPGKIPSPLVFHEMDTAHTLDAVLPGANVVRGGLDGDTPRAYFRKAAYDTFLGHLDPSHETLLETLRAVNGGTSPDIACPITDCDHRYSNGHEEYACHCQRQAALFETDALRFHERFQEEGSNGEVHGEVRRVLEVLALINILRYFERKNQLHFLREAAFVLDGPLAVFGQPARIAPLIRREILRISSVARQKAGADLLIIGIEKGGQYAGHFEDLDWSDEGGPRGRFPPSTTIVPDAAYINEHIVRRPKDAKPSGEDTYFGRKVFYKTRHGSHATFNLAMVNDVSTDFTSTSLEGFPRLGDALNVLDHLSTYLQDDGFMPLIKAQSHAAIPLRQGGEILSALFDGS